MHYVYVVLAFQSIASPWANALETSFSAHI